MYEFVELGAVSSYLTAVVAITKRCRDRLLRLSSTAVVYEATTLRCKSNYSGNATAQKAATDATMTVFFAGLASCNKLD